MSDIKKAWFATPDEIRKLIGVKDVDLPSHLCGIIKREYERLESEGKEKAERRVLVDVDVFEGKRTPPCEECGGETRRVKRTFGMTSWESWRCRRYPMCSGYGRNPPAHRTFYHYMFSLKGHLGLLRERVVKETGSPITKEVLRQSLRQLGLPSLYNKYTPPNYLLGRFHPIFEECDREFIGKREKDICFLLKKKFKEVDYQRWVGYVLEGMPEKKKYARLDFICYDGDHIFVIDEKDFCWPEVAHLSEGKDDRLSPSEMGEFDQVSMYGDLISSIFPKKKVIPMLAVKRYGINEGRRYNPDCSPHIGSEWGVEIVFSDGIEVLDFESLKHRGLSLSDFIK